MIRRIDHVSIAVRDLERAKRFFLDVLGGREVYSYPLEDQGFRWTTIELGSSSLVELINPLGDAGFLPRFLETRGEGVHHVTIQVDDVEAAEAEINARGVPTFGGGEGLPGWQEFFVHPKHAFGALLQFAQFDPLDWIYPGYVPRAYAEFDPSPRGPAEVRTASDGEIIEISDGMTSVRVSREGLPDLIRRLQGLAEEP